MARTRATIMDSFGGQSEGLGYPDTCSSRKVNTLILPKTVPGNHKIYCQLLIIPIIIIFALALVAPLGSGLLKFR